MDIYQKSSKRSTMRIGHNRQTSDFISTEPSDGIISKPGSSYRQTIRSAQSRPKVGEELDAATPFEEELEDMQSSAQIEKDRVATPGRIVFYR